MARPSLFSEDLAQIMVSWLQATIMPYIPTWCIPNRIDLAWTGETGSLVEIASVIPSGNSSVTC